jgi:hypothetical protein
MIIDLAEIRSVEKIVVIDTFDMGSEKSVNFMTLIWLKRG